MRHDTRGNGVRTHACQKTKTKPNKICMIKIPPRAMAIAWSLRRIKSQRIARCIGFGIRIRGVVVPKSVYVFVGVVQCRVQMSRRIFRERSDRSTLTIRIYTGVFRRSCRALPLRVDPGNSSNVNVPAENKNKRSLKIPHLTFLFEGDSRTLKPCTNHPRKSVECARASKREVKRLQRTANAPQHSTLMTPNDPFTKISKSIRQNEILLHPLN